LQQALANAKVQTGVQVVRTENHFRSMSYLAAMSRSLGQIFANKRLYSVDRGQIDKCSCLLMDSQLGLLKFRALYEDSAKNAQLTVREVFVQQLLQLHSLSLERAMAIVERYPTPRCLLEAYEVWLDPKQARLLLSSIPCGPLERPLGDKISQCLHEFYTTHFR